MKVGDIGILQNLNSIVHMNGLVAEITAEIQPGDRLKCISLSGNHTIREALECGWIIRCFSDRPYAISKDKIRPIDDPDADYIDSVEQIPEAIEAQ
jgi:hypothetical protein